MKHLLLCLFALVIVVPILGCGGGNGNDDGNNDITIRNFGFNPRTKTVNSGDTVRWVNADTVTHSVVSGTLGPVSNPIVEPINVIDNHFESTTTNIINNTLTVKLGDVIRFTNLDTLTRQIEVKDQQTLEPVFISQQIVRNQTADWKTATAGAGFYTVRDSLNPAIPLTVIVIGVPHPDGKFSSGILAPGDKFEVQFDTPGTFPYFCGVHNEEAGQVVVEP